MKKELIEQYYTNFLKYENKEWNYQQWYDYCTVTLEGLMKEHSNVYFELKESSKNNTDEYSTCLDENGIEINHYWDDDDKYGTYRADDNKPHHRPVHDRW